jgi:signal transduction histidine kinase
MQLEALARRLGDGERDQIRRLQDDLKAEHRQLRQLIGSAAELPPDHRRPSDFLTEVQNLSAVLGRRWNATITVEAEPGADGLPAPLAFELLQIVREAISNAVRHGRASAVAIRATRSSERFELSIADDGIGMPVHGVFNMAQLKDLAVGPRSLRSRVASLGGDLIVESRPTGVTLRISAPLGARVPVLESSL